MTREGEQKQEFSETFAVLDKDQDTVISREGHQHHNDRHQNNHDHHHKDQETAEKIINMQITNNFLIVVREALIAL